jgi:hypothetical protein
MPQAATQHTVHTVTGALRRDAVVALAYVLATALTDAAFMGDTPGYARAILAYEHGGAYIWDNPFWEFGHLLWRPLGWLAFRASRPLTALFVGGDERLQVTLALMWLNWLAGLACVLMLRRLCTRMSGRAWVGTLTTLVFLAAHAFLNYAQTGCAYVPGLALLLAGLCLLARGILPEGIFASDEHAPHTRSALAAGACLAGAVSLWFPYVLVVPAALALPPLLGGSNRRRLRATAWATGACAVCGALLYGAVLAHLGIHDLAHLKAWMAAAGHGYNRTGLARMLFGLARSFMHMGQDGILLKRFMLHDPYNPVTLRQLFGASLWQLAIFYLTAAALMLRLLSGRNGRRVLALLAVACAPVFAFALFIFEGGMPERYLPLFPFVFVALACALDEDARRPPAFFRVLALVFAAAVVVANARALAKPLLARRQAAVAARLADLPVRLRPHSVVAVVHLQDELADFYFNYPFHPINRSGQLEVYNVLEPGAARIATWRTDFARTAQTAWAAGGDVWLSRRFFTTRPQAEWNWVEGDERRVTWADLPQFFAQFETGDAVGDADGFVLLARTPRNEALLARWATGADERQTEQVNGGR